MKKTGSLSRKVRKKTIFCKKNNFRIPIVFFFCTMVIECVNDRHVFLLFLVLLLMAFTYCYVFVYLDYYYYFSSFTNGPFLWYTENLKRNFSTSLHRVHRLRHYPSMTRRKPNGRGKVAADHTDSLGFVLCINRFLFFGMLIILLH